MTSSNSTSDNMPGRQQYYADVAFRFVGGAEWLRVCVSWSDYQLIYGNLETGCSEFFGFRTVYNEKVIIRTEAIVDADLRSGDEKYQDNPAFVSPGRLPLVKKLEVRDWEIVDDILMERESTTALPERVSRLKREIKGLGPENRRQMEVLVHHLRYQLSQGCRSSVYVEDEAHLQEVLSRVEQNLGDQRRMIGIKASDDREFFIKRDEVDYFIAPTHRMERGRALRQAR